MVEVLAFAVWDQGHWFGVQGDGGFKAWLIRH